MRALVSLQRSASGVAGCRDHAAGSPEIAVEIVPATVHADETTDFVQTLGAAGQPVAGDEFSDGGIRTDWHMPSNFQAQPAW